MINPFRFNLPFYSLLILSALAASALLAHGDNMPRAYAMPPGTPTPSATPSPIIPQANADALLPPQAATPGTANTLTDIPATQNVATATPFPTASFTPRSRQPTRTLTATPRWPGRKRSATPYPTYTNTPPLTPTITLTPTPPMAYLRLSKPGNWSKVTNNFQIEANVAPGQDGGVRLDLLGEDSRAITRQILKSGTNTRFLIAPRISFDITAVAETARLILSVQDLSGRQIALTSVDLILLLLGSDDIKPRPFPLEPYVIWSPVHKQTISGGIVYVEGLAQPANNNPLILELIDERGNTIGSQQIPLNQPPSGNTHSHFVTQVTYTVSASTPARLILRQESAGRIPGTVALSSLLLTLEP